MPGYLEGIHMGTLPLSRINFSSMNLSAKHHRWVVQYFEGP